MSIYRLGEPYPVLESEGSVGESTNRTNIDHITYKIIMECFLNIGSNFGMITSVKYAMNTFFSELVGNKNAAITKYATGHVQLDIFTKVVFFEGTLLVFETGAFFSMFIAKILEVAFAGLVADGTIKGMIKQQEFSNACTGIEYAIARDIFYDHSIHYIGATTCNQFGHGAWIGGGTGGNFNQAGAAFTTTVLELAIIAHCWRSNFTTNHACSIQNRCAGLNINGDVVDRYLE